METIKESIKILMNVGNHRKLINDFAKSNFDEKFKDNGGSEYINYINFDLISENKIRVNYVYGAGDLEFNSSYIIEI